MFASLWTSDLCPPLLPLKHDEPYPASHVKPSNLRTISKPTSWPANLSTRGFFQPNQFTNQPPGVHGQQPSHVELKAGRRKK